MPLEGVAFATNSTVAFWAAARGAEARIAETRKQELQIAIFMMFIVAEWQARRYEVVVMVNPSRRISKESFG